MSKLGKFLLLILILLPTQVLAISSNWQGNSYVDVRLISALEGTGERKNLPFGLEVKLEPGWHVYWRSPGAAGLPPQFDWSRSETAEGNLGKATILYPAPTRYNSQGLETIGYQNHVIFPIMIEPKQIGRAVHIDTTLNLLVCSSVCVPKNFDIQLNIPSDSAIEGPEADVLNPVLAAIPNGDADKAGLAVTDIDNDGKTLTLAITSAKPLAAPDVFVESEHEIPFTAPVVLQGAGGLSATMKLKLTDPQYDLAKLPDTPLKLTLVDGSRAVEADVVIPPLPGSTIDGGLGITFRTALMLAIVGGLLLNFMPCVLPVLSLKIIGLVGHGGSHPSVVRRSFLTSACGIMFSFMALAAMTVMLKSFGLALGWGVQFQQPIFLIGLTIVLTFFAANMWGFFDIRLPPAMMDKIADHHPKMAGDFATGALATLLATPCTAPFLGTAVGFAFAAGTSREIVGIFFALGFGMTLPYLTIAFVPKIATILPKPGAWMVRLRVALGFALAFTAVWLIWVLSAQLTLAFTGGIAACMLGIVALISIKPIGMLTRTLGMLAVVGLVVVAVTLALGGAPVKQAAIEADHTWQAFDEPAIALQVASGHIVFVDITADWCLTCKANKKFVLSADDITERLFHTNVIAMQGDWTNPDPAIADFLHTFRRYGIPFDAVYGPGAPLGITLPELLTHDVVMDALNKASGQ